MRSNTDTEGLTASETSEERSRLEQYLALHPDLRSRLRPVPASVRINSSWHPIARVRICRDGLRILLKNGGRLTLSPETKATGRRQSRLGFFEGLLARHLPDWRIVRVLAGSNRNNHQTGAFLRVILQKGNQLRPLLIAYSDEPAELSSRILSSAVLWWDQLRQGPRRPTELALFLPAGWSERLLLFLPKLRAPFRCFKYEPGNITKLAQIYPRPVEKSEIHSPYVVFQFEDHVPDFLAEASRRYPLLDLTFRQRRWELSYLGLRVMWFEKDRCLAFFDLARPTILTDRGWDEFDCHVKEVVSIRSFPPPAPGHFYYRFAPEKWLESLILRKHRLLNREFADTVYCQVPTCLDGERKILDLLTITDAGRLAVIELKVDKDLDLVFQGLDYWERVDHHARQGDFTRAGYFPGASISREKPLLYLVAPLFEYHRILPTLRSYLKADVSFRCIGINSNWRTELRILRRFALGREEGK